MQQLSLPFPREFLAPPALVQEAPLFIAHPVVAAIRAIWVVRQEQAAIAERAYYAQVAADNQLVLAFLDVGLTRRARQLAQWLG